MRISLGRADGAAQRSVRAELVLAVSGKTAAAFGTVGLAAISPFVRDEFGLSTFGVGGVIGVVFIGALVATIPAGRLTDRVRAGRMLGGCLGAQAGALVIAALAPNQGVFFLGVALAGLAMGAGDPSTNVLVAMNVTRRRRGLIMGLKQTGFTLGGLLGGLMLPSVAEAAGWRSAVVVPMVLCALVAVAGIAIAGDHPARASRTVGERVRNPSQTPLGVYGFLMAGIQLSTVGLLAVYLVDKGDFSPRLAGWAIAVALVGGTSGRILWGLASDRVKSSRLVTLQIAAAGAGVASMLIAVIDSDVAIWPVLFVLGFCAVGWNTVYVTVAAESVDAASVGRATGAALFFSYAGALAIPPLLGVVVDGTESWTLAWFVAALIGAGGLVAATRARTLEGRREPSRSVWRSQGRL